jgi:alkyl hydroperoxide reductase subunit AhpC
MILRKKVMFKLTPFCSKHSEIKTFLGMNLGSTLPNFSFNSSHGWMDFYTYIEGSWAVLFSHPADFTPVCTTELGAVGGIASEFERRGVKIIGLSCDTVENHAPWNADIKATQGNSFDFPIISDPTRDIAATLGMLDPLAK